MIRQAQKLAARMRLEKPSKCFPNLLCWAIRRLEVKWSSQAQICDKYSLLQLEVSASMGLARTTLTDNKTKTPRRVPTEEINEGRAQVITKPTKFRPKITRGMTGPVVILETRTIKAFTRNHHHQILQHRTPPP